MVNCLDAHCPTHGTLSVRGLALSGTIIGTKMRRTAIFEMPRRHFISKYQRYEKRRTKIKVHNPDCIQAKVGDSVQIKECRPLSKTKSFVIIEVNKNAAA